MSLDAENTCDRNLSSKPELDCKNTIGQKFKFIWLLNKNKENSELVIQCNSKLLSGFLWPIIFRPEIK
jgi:hypothetical protein